MGNCKMCLCGQVDKKVDKRSRGRSSRSGDIISLFRPPRKTKPLIFLTTPQKKENPFFRQLIKINQYNYNCTSSMYSVPVQCILYQFRKNCTKGKNCTTTSTTEATVTSMQVAVRYRWNVGSLLIDMSANCRTTFVG